MSIEGRAICAICQKADGRETAKLREKGCEGLMTASQRRGDQLTVVPGQVVHHECRRTYCHPNSQRSVKSSENTISSPSTRNSCHNRFDFQTNCLFCGTNAKYKERKRGYDVFPVRTLEFQSSIKDICKERSDEWGNEVLGRIEFAQDLPAIEARYHQTCRYSFLLFKCLASVTKDKMTRENRYILDLNKNEV